MVSHRTRLAAAAIAGVLVVDCTLAFSNIPYEVGVSGDLVIAFLASQVGLHSAWVALGHAGWLLRATTLVPVWIGVGLYLQNWAPIAMNEMAVVFPAEAGIAIGVLLVMRLLRFQLTSAADREAGSLTPSLQYSIRDMLTTTTILCVAAAGLVRLRTLGTGKIELISALVGVGGCFAAATLMSVIASLGMRRVLLPLLVACGLSAALGWGFAMVLLGEATSLFVFLVGATAVIELVPLLVLRRMGYRLQKRPKATG